MQKKVIFKYIFTFIVMILFTACGGSSSSSKEENSKIVGYLIDSPVANLSYQCGGATAKTGTDGKFECNELPVIFMVGDIEVGRLHQMTDDGKVYPQDLAGVARDDFTHPEVLKIASFLQSLDDDGDISIAITIPDNLQIDSTKNLSQMSQAEVEELLRASGIEPVTLKEAEEHLRENTPIEDNQTDSSSEEANTPETNSSSSSDAPTEESNSSSSNTTTTGSNTNIKDTTPPTKPTLTSTPTITNQESVQVEVNGEVGATLFVNSTTRGELDSNGTLIISLDTSGADGFRDFNITIKDSSNNESYALNLRITKDATAPATNATMTRLITDDTTPALGGNLPTGSSDSNTINYTVSIEIDNETYSATNDRDGSWSLSDNLISTLDEGIYSIKIIVSDEAKNESNTTIPNIVEINTSNTTNNGFFIDSKVEGVRYVSGSYSGYTDSNGMFKYEKDSEVNFYIGEESSGISLGSAVVKTDPYNSERKIVTIFDVAGSQDENSQKVLNMGKLLQSLDVDKDVSNGITIDSRSKESIALLGLKEKIDFDVEVETFHNNSDIYNLFNDLATHFGEHRGLVDTDDAKAHLVAVRDNNFTTKRFDTGSIVTATRKEIEILTGTFKTVGGVVEGLEYRSGNQFGRTTATGEFKYEEGKKVKFYIYQLELGITEAKAIVTPADLVPSTSFNHPKPRNIIRLLNAFDAVADDSKVTIDKAVRESLEKYRSQIDLNLQDGKANAELSIPAGADEFGAQFEDFEMGKEILDEIDRLRV
ncbi:hypothetical protein GSY74_05900 [Sulfurovum sp. bin170]|uniref:Ig-like domain-containing protein n=1 Tax=Sulfurovum sp. bin170 TaxID=2695268 RepID=UPI0013DEE9D2|nr:Ig-like domain-containing protein [Sulfurovum sp. bin170]NEW60810.1 hypothetical protein [Sulfurovum sp. bin170]